MSTAKTFWVTSLYGYKTKQPRVNVAMPGGEYVQMSPAEARDLALNILRCADAADSDGFVVEFLQEKVKITEKGSAQILNEFRQWRAKHEASQ